MLRNELKQFSHAIRSQAALPDGMAFCPHYAVASALDIYRNNYRSNLQGALADAYPVTERIVGADFFRMVTRKFVELHPSRSGNLHQYGREMADFLASFSPAQTLPYLPDVARLEWACHLAYYAPDVPTFELARLQHIPANQYADLAWSCHPSTCVMHSPYPLVEIWLAHQPGANEDFNIDLGSGGGTVLVIRHDITVEVHALAADQADWLQRMQAGALMGEATNATVVAHPDFDLTATLSHLMALNVLVDFSLP